MKNSIERYNQLIIDELGMDNDFESLENLTPMQIERLKLAHSKGIGSPVIKNALGRMVTVPGNPTPNSYVGQVDLFLQYDRGADLNEVLPVPIFSVLSRYGLYKGLEYYGLGRITAVSDTPNAQGRDEITYSDGTLGARILVQGINFDYMSLLNNSRSDELQIDKIRFQCDAGLEASFFNTGIKTYGRTALGKTFSNDSVPFLSQQSPVQYRGNILDVDAKLKVQKDLGFVYYMPKFTEVGESKLIVSLFLKSFTRK